MINKYTTERPVSVNVLVTKYLTDKALGNERKFDHFHPSAWGSCLRKIAYQYYNEQQPFHIRTAKDVVSQTERIFDNGHYTHARWQNYLDCAGVLRGYWECINPLCEKVYGKEELIGIFNPLRTDKNWKCSCGNNKKLEYCEIRVKSEKEFNFEGNCDAVIDARNSPYARGDKYDIFVVDFKTIKDEQYMALDGAKEEHIIQVHIYMWILNIHAAVVVYENKDDQKVREEFVPRDESIIEKIKGQAVWLIDLLKNKKLPLKPSGFTKSSYPCRFCEFKETCFR
jgi:hypothetical protein